MKKFVVFIGIVFALASCKSSYDSAAMYDDVYYSPRQEKKQAAAEQKTEETSGLVYGTNTISGTVDDSGEKSADNSDYQSYYYSETADTLPPAETSHDNYSQDEYDDYYDYDYAARIDRFHNSTGDFGYYDPVYTNSASSGCGPNVSFNMGFGYGWGYPYSSFSMGFGYGFPYYSPWYDPWYYNPWYSPYYGYGGYWSGYNAGYYNGYWNGYYAGGGYYPGYYPGGDYGYYPGDYYGPRTSRGGGVVNNDTGEDENRDSRIGGGNGTLGSGIPAGSIGGATTLSSDNGGSLSKTAGDARPSRQLKPVNGPAEVSGKPVTEPQAEKLTKPHIKEGIASQSQGKTTHSGVSHAVDEPSRARKLAKPVQQETVSKTAVAPASRQQHATAKKSYVAPAGSRDNGVISRTKKYAKPVANDLQKSTRTKSYSTPGYNRPRASNEYIVPSTGTIGRKGATDDNANQFIRSDRSRSVYSPSRSTNSFSQPRQSKSYTSPVRTGRSLSSPVRSTPSYSSPSRSSGFSPSRSSGSSRSTGSSSSGGGKRGR